MDFYKILDKHYLSFIWIANPKWHFFIVAGFSIITFLFDLLFSGKKSILRIMQQLKDNSNNEIPDYANLRFSYLYHYYHNRSIYNYGWLLYSKVEDIRKAMTQVRILGLDNFQQALSSEKAIIIFSAHLGCFFNALFCERLAKLINGRKVVLLSPENEEKRKKLIKNQIRETFPGVDFGLIDLTVKTDAIKIFHALRKKDIVACNLDYAYPFTTNKTIEFFGRKVDFPIGLIEIGRKIDVTYLPYFSYIKNGQIALEFMEPFPSVQTENVEKDVDDISAEVNNILEKKILEMPEQWSFWLRLYYSDPA
jgi:lauroyl/myristoyl acyltransferase